MSPTLLPILIPLLTAAVALLFRSRPAMQRGIALAGGGALAAAAAALLRAVWREGMVTVQIGDWPAPFGITLVADLLSALLVAATALVGLVVTVYSLAGKTGDRSGHYYPLLAFLLAGTAGAFLAGDIFNLYVWFEVLLIASFVLMSLAGEKAQLAGAIRYMALNLLSSAFFLAAVGLLYAAAGTLNFAHLAHLYQTASMPPLVHAVSMLLLAAFGIKGAVFPFFFWLPPSYPTPPPAVSALFAGLLTEVGMYALVRFFTLLPLPGFAGLQALLLGLAVLSLLTGVFGAMVQDDLRRLLSLIIVSDSGFLLLGLGIFSPAALAGTIFFFLHVMIVKTNLFLVAGAVERLSAERAVSRMGGLRDAAPGVSLIFLLCGLSLAGVPPLSGFWAKLALIKAGLEAGAYVAAGAALVAGLLILLAITRVWSLAFWGMAASPDAGPPAAPGTARCMPMWALTLLTVLVGLLAGPVLVYSERAARQLLDPQVYIGTVLGDEP